MASAKGKADNGEGGGRRQMVAGMRMGRKGDLEDTQCSYLPASHRAWRAEIMLFTSQGKPFIVAVVSEGEEEGRTVG